MTLPVIILNYNSADDCRKCVLSLKNQIDIELDIIIVDNCSDIYDKQCVKSLCEEYHCVLMESDFNSGYNAGNNIGLRYASEKSYDYALIANPDMIFPQKNYLALLMNIVENDKDIVMLGSDIQTLDGIHQNPRNYNSQKWWQSFAWIKDVFKKNDHDKIPSWIENPQISHFCNGLNGCCFIIRMSFVKQIGFFDEKVFLYGEESILARQVLLLNKKMYYYSGAYAVHNHKVSEEPDNLYRLKNWKRSRIHYVREYSGYHFIGKCFAIFSINVYFTLLRLKNRFLVCLKFFK